MSNDDKAWDRAWEIAKTEYCSALELFRHFSSLRRQDMLFVATIQAAALTLIGDKLLKLDLSRFMLSLVAFCVLFLGLNSERRLSAYMFTEMERAREIEKAYDMKLVSAATTKVGMTKMLLSNAAVFRIYYAVFLIAWLSIWALNLRR
jgi:hypothetical protein